MKKKTIVKDYLFKNVCSISSLVYVYCEDVFRKGYMNDIFYMYRRVGGYEYVLGHAIETNGIIRNYGKIEEICVQCDDEAIEWFKSTVNEIAK